jgi:hypothetical protein
VPLAKTAWLKYAIKNILQWMVRVIRPEDVLKGREKMLEELARDLAPGQAERVRDLLRRWGADSKEELMGMLGKERGEKLLRRFGIF